MLKQLSIYIFVFIAFCGCREDFEQNIATPVENSPTEYEDYTNEENMVISSLTGFVTDASENPLRNALVVLGNYSTSTDDHGHFFFTDTPMNSNGTMIETVLDGYHLSSKLFYPASETMEHIEVIMTKIEKDSELDGLSSGVVLVANDIELEYSTNSFINSTGNIYSGSVNISSSFVPVSEAFFAKKALGNLQCVNEKNNIAGLQAHSLLYLNFTDDNGVRLEINANAELYVTIPRDTISEDVLAWYYAPAFGLYTVNKEIENTLSSTRIRIKHNEAIMLASYDNTILNKVSLSASDGNQVLENVEVALVNEDGNTIYVTRSNSSGEVSVPIPQNTYSTLQIKDACGNIIYNESAANASTDLVLQDVELKSIEGEVFDCDVKPSSNNVIRVSQGAQTHYYYRANSAFNLSLQTCNNGQSQVTALDDANIEVSSMATIDLNEIESFGDLFTCPSPKLNQLKITDLDSGATYTYPITSAFLSGTIFTFGNINSTEEQFQIEFNGNNIGIGDYSDPASHSILRLWDEENGFKLAGDADSFLVDRYGDDNRITIGIFEGNFINTISSETKNVRGEFNFYFQE